MIVQNGDELLILVNVDSSELWSIYGGFTVIFTYWEMVVASHSTWHRFLCQGASFSDGHAFRGLHLHQFEDEVDTHSPGDAAVDQRVSSLWWF